MNNKAYHKAWYQAHKEEHKKNANRRRNEQAAIAQKNVVGYLKTHPCVDCGESDIVVLQFDHVRGEKKCEISKMIHGGYPWETILEEIAKCEVRCANDHMRRTSQVQGNYRIAA